MGLFYTMKKIYWIEPYALDKNIGAAYNEMVSLMPEHSWIGITDHDMMFLVPDAKKRISELITDDYELYGCLTNRLFGEHQAPFRGQDEYPNMSLERDILKHKRFAEFLSEERKGIIAPTTSVIAGMMMVFNKDTWKRVGGFDIWRIDYDILFSEKIEKKAILNEIYVLHDYRMPCLLEDAQFFTNHLR
jgi:hypothetical protein